MNSFADQIKAENNKKTGNVDYVKLISQKRQKEKLQEANKQKFIKKVKPISKRTSTKLIDYVDIDEEKFKQHMIAVEKREREKWKARSIYNNYYSDDEIKILTDNYSKMTAEEMEGLLPGRSKHSIHKKAEQLGIRKVHKNGTRELYRWSKEECKILTDNLYSSYDEIFNLIKEAGFDRCKDSVRDKAYRQRKKDISKC